MSRYELSDLERSIIRLLPDNGMGATGRVVDRHSDVQLVLQTQELLGCVSGMTGE